MRPTTTTAVALALASMCLAPAATAASKRVQRTVTDHYPAKLTLGGTGARSAALGATRETTVRGGARASTTARRIPRGMAGPYVRTARSSGYKCVKNRRRRGFVSYPAHRRSAANDAYYINFLYYPYKQNRARYLTGRGRMKQIEICTLGGASTRGGNKLSRVVTSMTMLANPKLIGWKYDVGEEQSEASASLSFEVPIKAVTIGGSIDVHPQDEFSGSQGPDKDAPDAFEPYLENQVNAFWEGSDTFVWQGSSHFQGNVGHGLWELRQKARTPSFYFAPSLTFHCGRPNYISSCDKP